MPYYIGIANTCHDPAVAIISPEGELVFAEAHERHFQQKRAWDLPPDHGGRLMDLIQRYCDPQEGFVVATPWKTPGLMGKRFEEGDGAVSPDAAGLDPVERAPNSLFKACDGDWLLWSQKRAYEGCGRHLLYLLRHYFGCGTVQYRQYDHHLAHAAQACFTSPFNEALCLIADGEGEIGSASVYSYAQGELHRLGRSWGPGSLGRLYAKVTDLCGFDWRKGEEGKVMGLAAHGQPRAALARDLAALVSVNGCQVVQAREAELAEIVARLQNGGGYSREDLAHTGQKVFERIMLDLLGALYRRGGSRNLVLGGGCALNSSCNGMILGRTEFQAVHVPCAPADDGNAAGAAFLAFWEDHPESVGPGQDWPASWASPYLGSALDESALARMVHSLPAGMLTHHPGSVHERAAELIAQGQVLGWVQGRAEYGPRSLGNRSILADPRRGDMPDRLNRDVKFREDFRPFAPAVLEAKAGDWFESPQPSPYMSFTLPWRPGQAEKVPAVVHADGTGRLQTVDRELNPRFHGLLAAFDHLTGVPLLLNTSLNIMGKPMAHSVEDVIGIFFTTGMDALVVGDYLIQKKT